MSSVPPARSIRHGATASTVIEFPPRLPGCPTVECEQPVSIFGHRMPPAQALPGRRSTAALPPASRRGHRPGPPPGRPQALPGPVLGSGPTPPLPPDPTTAGDARLARTPGARTTTRPEVAPPPD